MPRVGPFLYRKAAAAALRLGASPFPRNTRGSRLVACGRGVRGSWRAAARVGPTPIRSSGKFSGSWAVASRNTSLHNAETIAT
jgi:hypothetical protein